MQERVGMDILKEYQKNLNHLTNNYKENDKLFELYRNSSTDSERIINRNKIMEANLPLITKLIRYKYNYNFDINPVYDMDDIIQEANLILIKAMDDYDSTRGNFSTYVFMKIAPYIYYSNGIPNSPFHFKRGLASRYKKVKKLFDLGYNDEFISEHYQIDIENVKRLRRMLQDSLSYDELLSKGLVDDVIKKQDAILGDYMISKIDEEPNVVERNEQLYKLLDQLKPAERDLIMNCYGLNNQTQISIVEYCNRTGIPYITAYKRHQRILNKLRSYKLLRLALSVEFGYTPENISKGLLRN